MKNEGPPLPYVREDFIWDEKDRQKRREGSDEFLKSDRKIVENLKWQNRAIKLIL